MSGPGRGRVRRGWSSWLYWAIVVFWIGLIFWFSNQPATESQRLSGGVIEALSRIFRGILPASFFTAPLLHTVIRKTAHFLNYAVLGVWVSLAVENGRDSRGGVSLKSAPEAAPRTLRFAPHMRRLAWGQVATQVLVICLFAAIFDEIHQLFIPGRSGEIRDVLIDLAGSATGHAVLRLVRSWRMK